MSAPTNPIQADLEAWDGIGDPPGIETIRQQPEYQALPPVDRVRALNQAQRMAADRLRTDGPEAYGGFIRDVEADFAKARAEEVETALAADLRDGALTDSQVAAYMKGGTAALANEGEAAGYVRQKYGDDADRQGPWVTRKLPLMGADNKPAGFVHVRHDPRLNGEALRQRVKIGWDGSDSMAKYMGNDGSDRVEVSWTVNADDGQHTGTADVPVGDFIARTEASRYMLKEGQSILGRELEYKDYLQREVNDMDAIPDDAKPAFLAMQTLKDRPEIADKVGQGFWKGLPGEMAKGFLSLGAAAYHGPAALTGDKAAVEAWQQGQADIGADIEGQSRLGFRGSFTDQVLRGVSAEAIPMAFSMGSSAVGAVARKALSSAVGKGFAGRMAALEMEAAGKTGLTGLTPEAAAKTLAAELTGEGVGTGARQAFHASIGRGLFGKWLGTAEIEGPLARQLADRVSNAVAFLPSSARSGLDNMARTFDKAEELRAAGDEAGARAMEDRAVLNGWAGVGIETFSENLWLNEMMVTRTGRTLGKVTTDVLERTITPGRMAALTNRAKAALKTATVAGAQEGTEEVAAGVGNRAWLNEFAAQNKDLLEGVGVEFATGAVLGALMRGARELAHDGKPAAFRELALRGLDGDPAAMESLARIRAKAEAGPAPGKPVAEATPPPVTGPVTRLPNLHGSAPPPPVNGDAAEAPAGEMSNMLVPPADPQGLTEDTLFPGNEDPPQQTLLPELDTTTGLPKEDGRPPLPPGEGYTAPDYSQTQAAAPGTTENPPAPDTPETVAEQLRLTRSAASTRRATLLTPGTQVPTQLPRGLERATTRHGVVIFSPKKITRAEVAEAARGETFDATVLGQSGQTPAASTTVVTASTPAAQNVHAELVPDNDPAALAAATRAAAAAVPGGTVEVKPAAQVLQERAAAQVPGDFIPNSIPDANRQPAIAAEAAAQPELTTQPADAPSPARGSKPQRNPKAAGRRSEAGQPGAGASGVATKASAPASTAAENPAGIPQPTAFGEWAKFQASNDLLSGRPAATEAAYREKWEAMPDHLRQAWSYLNGFQETPPPDPPAPAEDTNRFSVARTPDAPTGVTDKAAADAVRILRSNAPELLRDVLTVRNVGQLDRSQFTPTQWAAISAPNVEAFFIPSTGKTAILLDNIQLRPGETPIGAVARLILHERLGHAGLSLLRKSDPTFAREWSALTDLIPTEELLALIPAYPHLANDPEKLAEEWFAARAEQAKTAPPGSLLRRMWEAIKHALTKVWHGLRPGKMSLDERTAELIYRARKALRRAEYGGGTATDSDPMASKFPLESRDWASTPLPAWAKRKMGAYTPTAFDVAAGRPQAIRAMLTGSKMPRAFADIADRTKEEVRAVTERGAIIGRDLQAAIKAHAKRNKLTELAVGAMVNTAMEDPVAMAALPDSPLKVRAIAARNYVDALSAQVAATTGGEMAKTIMANAGSWLRRGYAVFDASSGWDGNTLRAAAAAGKTLAGKDARKILNDARAHLTAAFPKLTPEGIEAMISDLTNRDSWQSAVLGIPRPDGIRVTRDVSSLMRRKDIAAPVRALMGEELNPIKRLAASISFQAQLIARYDQQRAMRDLGLRMGIFSTTADGTYHKPVGGTDVHGDMRWNGFAWQNPATGKFQPVYTTPEMLAAMATTPAGDGLDAGKLILHAFKALGTSAKMNKVALNPDSWSVNIMGGMLGLVQSGDAFHFAGLQRLMQAIRIQKSAGPKSGTNVDPVAEAIRDNNRLLLAHMAAAGVANASFDMRDLEASLDNATLAFIEGGTLGNIASGVVSGAVIGQSFGRAGGAVGRAIGGAAGAVAGGIAGGKRITAAQRAIARKVLSAPDNAMKITVFLGNYATMVSSGMSLPDAFAAAAEKTRNTMPDYSKLPAFLRDLSTTGLLGSFIAFQYEVYRNFFWTARYVGQELGSGNKALFMRGLRRFAGLATVTALGGGLMGTIAAHLGLALAPDDDKDQAYRRSLGAPWERYANLAYSAFDETQASFFNSSYLVPQSSLFEIGKAAQEGKTFEEGLKAALGALRRQFAGGSVHADPILEAITNTRLSGGKVSTEDGWRDALARFEHVLKVTLEPGAAAKTERLAKAARGEEDKRGRKFSLEEEALRFLGIRQATYKHADRIQWRMRDINEAYQDAKTTARKSWTADPTTRDATLARANDRIQAAAARWEEFKQDMRTIGVKASTIEKLRKEASLGMKFPMLKPGKDGPEPVKK